jgi:membrane protein
VNGLLSRLDAYQQRHPWAGFPFAVAKKFSDDQAGNLAALIAYYGFFSLFPLLLVLVTTLGFVLRGNEDLQQRVLDSALTQFPIIGDQIQDNVGSLDGSGLALVVGLAGAVYAGLRVMRGAQTALNTVWAVPRQDRPKMVKAIGRSLVLLVVLLGGVLAITISSAIATNVEALGIAGRVFVLVLSVALNAALFALAFRLLIADEVSWGEALPGSVVAAVGFQVLQLIGSWYVTRLTGSSQTYGFFGIVLGLLSWIFLQAQVLLISAEVNAVRAKRLWPRGLTQPPLTDGDKKALDSYAKAEQRQPEVDVRTEVQPGADTVDAAERENSPEHVGGPATAQHGQRSQR